MMANTAVEDEKLDVSSPSITFAYSKTVTRRRTACTLALPLPIRLHAHIRSPLLLLLVLLPKLPSLHTLPRLRVSFLPILRYLRNTCPFFLLGTRCGTSPSTRKSVE